MNTSQIQESLKHSPLNFGFFIVSLLISGFVLTNSYEDISSSLIIIFKLIILNMLSYILINIIFVTNYESIRKLFNANVLPLTFKQEDETTLLVKMLLFGGIPWCGWLGLTLKLGNAGDEKELVYGFLFIALSIPIIGYLGLKGYHSKILDVKPSATAGFKLFAGSSTGVLLLTSLGYFFG